MFHLSNALLLLASWCTLAATFARASPIATVVQSGLANPSCLTFGPDGSAVFGEQYTGNIYFKPAGKLDELNDPSTRLYYTVPDLVAKGERGLLGLALHPEWPRVPQLFYYATIKRANGGSDNTIIHLTNGTDPVKIWSVRSGSANHKGGPIHIHNGYLWAQVGDNGNIPSAQDTKTDNGKILVMNLDGSPPGAAAGLTRPPLSRHYARGVRNGFGFTWDPKNGRMWASENGPNCNDEINLVDDPKIKGVKNLGWGKRQRCNGRSAKKKSAADTNRDGVKPRIMPRVFFPTPIAVTALAFPSGDSPYMYAGYFKSPSRLFRITLKADRVNVAGRVRIEIPTIEGWIGTYAIHRHPVSGKLYLSVLTFTGGKIFRLDGDL